MNFHITYTESNADPMFLIMKSDGVKNYASLLNFKFQHTVHLKQNVSNRKTRFCTRETNDSL